jgi:hypothetical protein
MYVWRNTSPNSFFISDSLPTMKDAMNAKNEARWDKQHCHLLKSETWPHRPCLKSGSVAFYLSFNYSGRGCSIDEVEVLSQCFTKRVQNTNVIYVNSCWFLKYFPFIFYDTGIATTPMQLFFLNTLCPSVTLGQTNWEFKTFLTWPQWYLMCSNKQMPPLYLR